MRVFIASVTFPLPGDRVEIIESQIRIQDSGIRLGLQVLTRLGRGKGKEEQMSMVPEFIKRALIDKENPKIIASEVSKFMEGYQEVHYCFRSI